MDRSSLEVLLAQGLSLEEIGRRFGKHPSTIGYWVQKHGLEPAGPVKHRSRGGLSRELLEELIAQHLSVAKIATRTGFSETAVKYWLNRYDLRTRRQRVERRVGRQRRTGARWWKWTASGTAGRNSGSRDGVLIAVSSAAVIESHADGGR